MPIPGTTPVAALGGPKLFKTLPLAPGEFSHLIHQLYQDKWMYTMISSIQ